MRGTAKKFGFNSEAKLAKNTLAKKRGKNWHTWMTEVGGSKYCSGFSCIDYKEKGQLRMKSKGQQLWPEKSIY